MSNRKRISLLILTVIVAALLLILLSASVLASSSDLKLDAWLPDGNPLRAAWEKAMADGAGSYRFRMEVEQTFVPRSTAQSYNRGNERLDLHIEGAVHLPDHADVEMWAESRRLDGEPVRLIREGNATYIQRNGELEEIDEAPGALSPAGDTLGFLVAAENIEELEPVTVAGEHLRRYRFDVNGQRFAEHVRDEMMRQMQGKLPNQVTLQAPSQIKDIQATGELWVDVSGLPSRQILDYSMPEVNDDYNVSVHMVADYRDFGQVQAMGVPVPAEDSSWRIEQQVIGGIDFVERVRQVLAQLWGFTLGMALVVVLILYGRRRFTYPAVAVSIVFIMLVSPLLQSQQVLGYFDGQAEAAASRTSITAEDLGLGSSAADIPEEQQKTFEDLVSPQPQNAVQMFMEPQPLQLNDQDSGTPICGEGTIGVDSDGDGLDDYDETCYGTYYLDSDTDQDVITDTLEINGIVLADADGNPVTWRSNPIRADSNNDGLGDGSEWPAPVGLAPEEAGWDMDNDYVPNIWDPDNDGDEVPDNIDISPFAATPYTETLTLHTQGGSYDGYQYIEIQVRPQNPDHLRYSTTYLDWPDDEEGQIQDLDSSTDDVQLIPVLQVATNVKPELSDEYGVTVVDNTGDPIYDYLIYVPLQGVNDGGNISTFYGKVGYAPDEIANVQWKASMVWIVQAALDHYVNCSDPDNPSADTCQGIETNLSTVQTYTDTFSVTGFTVTKSENVEMGVFGTPQMPNEDGELFRLMFAMSTAFLNYEEPDLKEIQQRFNDPSATSAEKWGVTTGIVSDVQDFPHLDVAMATTTMTTTMNMLDTYYHPTDNPSLLFGTQQDIGEFNMNSLGGQPGATFSVALDNIHVFTQRGLKLATYANEDGEWTALSPSDTLDLMYTRYPDRTEEQTYYLNIYYPVWQVGQTTIIAVDGDGFVDELADDEEILDKLGGTARESVLGFIEGVSTAAEIFTALSSPSNGLGKYWQSLDNNTRDGIIGYGMAGAFFALAIVIIAGLVSGNWKEVLLGVLAIISTAAGVYGSYSAYKEVIEAAEAAGEEIGAFKALFSVVKLEGWGKVMFWAGLVIGLLFIWIFFAVFAGNQSGFETNFAFALAIAETILTLVIFILNFFVIGKILTTIYIFIDWIVSLGGKSISERFAIWFANNVVKIKTLTEVGDTSITKGGVFLANEDEGVIPGNTFVVTSAFSGSVLLDSAGDADDLKKSDIDARWQGSSEAATAVAVDNNRSCRTAVSEKNCSRELEMQYQLSEAGKNIELELLTLIDFKVRAESCFAGCSKETVDGTVPVEDDWEKDTEIIYLDVLPESLDELWDWQSMTDPDKPDYEWNPDRDGDGWLNASDPYPDNWDQDGDLLSDYFETNQGTDPDDWDSDDDDFGDGDEYRMGSNASNPDHDGDGLYDGEEWFHYSQVNDNWSGGWMVRLLEGNMLYVMSDPLVGDADGDSILDLTEKTQLSSPWAANLAPSMLTSTTPQASGPGGKVGTYVKPGDAVNWFMTVLNDSGAVISSTLSVCLPNPLTALQGGVLVGDRTVTMQTGSCSGGTQYAWDFSADSLGLGLQVTTTVTGTVDAGLTSSLQTQISTTLPYSNTELVRGDTINIDAEDPQVVFILPGDGDAVKGESINLHGTATDEISWIAEDTGVEVDLADGNGFQPATVTKNAWSIDWTLPSDGVYKLQARAYDYVGHEGSAQVNVTVDNTAPAATLAFDNGSVLSNMQMGSGSAVTVTLEGGATDNLSGVARVQVSIDRKGWEDASLADAASHPTQGSWSYHWRLPSADAQGTHTISVRSWDRAGNVSETQSRRAVIDMVAPADQASNLQSMLVAGQEFSLLGHANDIGNLPLPARPEALSGTLDAYADATIRLEPSSPLVTDNMQAVWLGDMNGDGRADLAVGQPASDNDAGRVSIVYGAGGGWPVLPEAVALSGSKTSYVGAPDAALGTSLASAGDVNGDGLYDLLIGDKANQRVFLVFGKPQNLAQDRRLSGPSSGDWVVLTTSENLQIGSWLASAGDVDGDGFDDILIGATNAGGGDGKAYLLKGQTQPWPVSLDLASEAASGLTLPGTGAPATGVGDVNADGYDDFVIADPLNSLGNGSQVFLYLGQKTLPTQPTASFVGDNNAAVGAQVVAMGDVNGDTLPDFAYSSGNAPRVAYGRNGSWSMGMAADVSFNGYSPAPNAFIAAPGDVDVDGVNDILLGATGGGGLAYLVLGSSDLTTNQPVQAQIEGVVGAASAPYAAGADLNCDFSSDLLLVPQSSQALTAAHHGLDMGPAAPPRALHELPSSGGSAQTPVLAAQALGAAQTTGALAFRIHDNNVDDWATNASIIGHWNEDALSDVAGWDGFQWQIWLSGGLSDEALDFNSYSTNLTSFLDGNDAYLRGDFDDNGQDDLAMWDGGSWQFVQAGDVTGSQLNFSAVSSNLGSLAGGDTSKILVGDFNGDSKSDLIGWDSGAWLSYISAATSSDFNFAQVSNDLGALAGGDATALIVGDFDGDGLDDIAARNDDDTAWVVWRSHDPTDSTLSFQAIADTSLGADITAGAIRRVADFNGDTVDDVVAVVGDEIVAWLGQGTESAMPFLYATDNIIQFSGDLLEDGLVGDFDGDSLADYASLGKDGASWTFQLGGVSAVRHVDDDYCVDNCPNDGYTWGVDAFATLQGALDVAGFADLIDINPGVYGPAVIHPGQDFLTLKGVDPDAVFLDAAGGVGIDVLPESERDTSIYSDIKGVTIQDLTIRNAGTGILVNYGGVPDDAPTANDRRNIEIKNVLIYQDEADSTAVETIHTALRLRHNTLVSNAAGVILVHKQVDALPQNYIFLQDNFFVALPNAAPLPVWWLDDANGPGPNINRNSGFASHNGVKTDWFADPVGQPSILMTLDEADFLNTNVEIFRIGAGSKAIGQAGDGKDLGYYNYHQPVYVNARYCATCAEVADDGRIWGVDAFSSIQAGIDSGAQRVLVDPGLYLERISLVNGVSVFGTGAGHTILAPPDDSAGYLVGVENAKETVLGLITLEGLDSADGIHVDAEGDIQARRLILRNTGTALSVTGSEALATLVNNTIVGNDYGINASQCGNLDIRNSILAYNQQTALSYGITGCGGTQTLLHTYNDYWYNGHDFEIDGGFKQEPGPGELFADPRFTDPSKQDYRPLADSPVVNAGEPSDPAPPGSGDRIDMGYAQSAEASVYASKSYCEVGCANDGLEWQVTAFNTIQDAIDHVPDIDGIWTVGVGGGTSSAPMVFQEHVTAWSGIRLVGSGATNSIIDGGGSGAVLTLDGVTHVEISGFTITNGGDGSVNPANAGIWVTGASNAISITRNIIGGHSPIAGDQTNQNGILFEAGSTGLLEYNTVAENFYSGVSTQDQDTWLRARYNIVALNDVGFDNSAGGQIFNTYNLVYNIDPDYCDTCANYQGSVAKADTELNDDPQFVDKTAANFTLTPTSPAVDAVPVGFSSDVPPGGGDRADFGYSELLARPVSLLLGKEGLSCALGNAGIDTVDVALVFVDDANSSVADTVPTSWQSATVSTPGDTGSYWNHAITPGAGDGLYRLYTRPTDMVGNVSDNANDWYRAEVMADGTPPQVTLLKPTATSAISAPALALKASATDMLSAGGVTLDTLDQVTFLVNGSTYVSSTLTSDGLYTALTPLNNGQHTIRAQATDKAGNVAQSSVARVIVVTTANVAMLAKPASGSAIATEDLTLTGYVHFVNTSGAGQVEVLIDDASQGLATLADTSAQSTSWSKAITLAGEGSHTLTLKASRTQDLSSGQDATATLILDTESPAVTLDAITQVMTDTVTFSGTATDALSGIAVVEVSQDGGRTWQAASSTGNAWSLSWQPPLQQDYVTYPIRARAIDQAGNRTTVSGTVIVDNDPPAGLVPVTFDPEEGSYLDGFPTLQISWTPLTDGSGVTSVLAVVDQFTDTVPSQVVSGLDYSANLTAAGMWYVHLMVQDGSGNSELRHWGPWIAGGSDQAILSDGSAASPQSTQPSGTLFAGSGQAILVDGFIDTVNGEWDTGTELLDDDTRPFQTQDLFMTWDNSYVYNAWQGGLWEITGAMAAYYDVKSGGTSTALIDNGIALGASPLPFDADYAVVISGPGTGGLWQAVGGSWQPDNSGMLTFAYQNGGAEWRLQRNSEWLGSVQMLAVAVDDDDNIWSIFPTNNSLTEAATTVYRWSGLTSDVTPNADQPTAHNVTLGVGSPLGGLAYQGPGSILDYLITVENEDAQQLANAKIELQAGENLSYVSVQGATCLECPPGGTRWLLELPPIDVGQTALVDVEAQLGTELGSQVEVDSTAHVILADGSSKTLIYKHPLDFVGPTVELVWPFGRHLRPGRQEISGVARDLGSGVGLVRWRIAGTDSWQVAEGTRVWKFEVDMPETGALTAEVQAVDVHGNLSDILSTVLTVDTVPPNVSFSAPPVVGGRSVLIRGVVADPHPQGGTIEAVVVEVEPGGEQYRIQRPFVRHDDGSYGWSLTWIPPQVEGQTLQLRAYAIDSAGNVGPVSASRTTIVDTLPPQTIIAEPENGMSVDPHRFLVWGITRDGWQVDRVQVSVDGLPWQEALVGDGALPILSETVILPQDVQATELWALFVAPPARESPFTIQVRAIDSAGNVETPVRKVSVQSAGYVYYMPLFFRR